ncbi:hypothetical protein ACJ41O_001435 [Fusarium nematophilum]
MYPLRRPLQLSQKGTETAEGVADSGVEGVDLFSLIKRRYFRRLWVIQELLLPREAAFQVGDVEFWMNSSTMARSGPHWKWDDTAAPWLQDLGQGTFRHKGLYEALRATCQSRSADPRDKVFGILAMVGIEPTSQGALQANYKLSCQHTFIGVFAHILLNLKCASVLRDASGLNATGSCPSWVPDWKSTSPAWIFQALHEPTKLHEKYFSPAWDNESDDAGFVLLHMSAMPKRWMTGLEMANKLASWIRLNDLFDAHPFADLNNSVTNEERITHSEPLDDATVDAATGALSINLMHLFAFSSVPSVVSNFKSPESSLFRLQSMTLAGISTVYLMASSPLDEYIIPGRDHLFALDTGDESFSCLILRQHEASTIFSLVTCCDLVTFRVPAGSLRTPFIEYCINTKLRSTEYPAANDLHNELYLADLQHSLYQSLQLFHLGDCLEQDEHQLSVLCLGYEHICSSGMHRAVRARYQRNQRPPKSADAETKMRETVILAIQAVLDEARGSGPGFLNTYVNQLPESLCPVIRDDHVYITVYYKSLAEFLGVVWEEQHDCTYKGDGVRPIQLRASKGDLREALKLTVTFQHLSELTPAVQQTNESEMGMARRRSDGPEEPREEDRLVTWPRWPKEIVDGFEIDGRTVRATIV